MGIKEKFDLLRMSKNEKDWDNPQYFNLRMADNPNKALDDYYSHFVNDRDLDLGTPLEHHFYHLEKYLKACGDKTEHIAEMLHWFDLEVEDWLSLAEINPHVFQIERFEFPCLYKCDELLRNLKEKPHLAQYLPNDVKESYEAYSQEQLVTPEGKHDLTDKIIPPHIRNKFKAEDLRVISEEQYFKKGNEDLGEKEEYEFFTHYILCAKSEYDDIYRRIHVHTTFIEENQREINCPIFDTVELDGLIGYKIRANAKSKEYFGSLEFSEEYIPSYMDEVDYRKLDQLISSDCFEDHKACVNFAYKFGTHYLEKFSPELMSNEAFIFEITDAIRESRNTPVYMNKCNVLAYATCESIFKYSKIRELELHHQNSINIKTLDPIAQRGLLTEEFAHKILVEFPYLQHQMKEFARCSVDPENNETYDFLMDFDFYERVFEENPEIAIYLSSNEKLSETLYNKHPESFRYLAEGIKENGFGRHEDHIVYQVAHDHILSMLNNNTDRNEIEATFSQFFSCRLEYAYPVFEKLMEVPQFTEFNKSLGGDSRTHFYMDKFCTTLDAYFYITDECGVPLEQGNLISKPGQLFSYAHEADRAGKEQNLAIMKEFYHEIHKTGTKFKDLPAMDAEETIHYAKSFLNSRDLKDKIEKETAEKPITKAQQLSNDLENDLAIAKPIQETKKARMKI